MRFRSLVPFLLIALAACSADAKNGAESASDVVQTDWQTIGTGVSYKRAGEGENVFIGYAGWSVREDWSRAWVSEVWRARLQEMGVGHLYAVQGPTDVGYSGLEIQNTKLGSHLVGGPGRGGRSSSSRRTRAARTWRTSFFGNSIARRTTHAR